MSCPRSTVPDGLMPSGFYRTDPYTMFANWQNAFARRVHTMWRMCVEHAFVEEDDSDYYDVRLRAYKYAVLKALVDHNLTKAFVVLVLKVWGKLTQAEVEAEFGGPVPRDVFDIIMHNTGVRLDTRPLHVIMAAQRKEVLSIIAWASKSSSSAMETFMLTTQRFDGVSCKCAMCIDMVSRTKEYERRWDEEKERLKKLPVVNEIVYIVRVMLDNAKLTCRLTEDDLQKHNMRMLKEATERSERDAMEVLSSTK